MLIGSYVLPARIQNKKIIYELRFVPQDNFPPPSRIFSLIIRIIFDRKDDEREGKEIREL